MLVLHCISPALAGIACLKVRSSVRACAWASGGTSRVPPGGAQFHYMRGGVPYSGYGAVEEKERNL